MDHPTRFEDFEFILLKDFGHAYENFPLKANVPLSLYIDPWLQDHVIADVEKVLRQCVRHLHVYDLGKLRLLARQSVESGAFVLTLDNRTYFDFADYSIEITRACYKLEHAGTGPYFRVPRGVGPMLHRQVRRLAEEYNATANGLPIVLCDDGIGTGRSLESVLVHLEECFLNVHRIVTLLNPNGLREIRGIDVDTVIDSNSPYIWLNERDIYWGLPRSGVSFTRPDALSAEYGIPYTLDRSIVENRIGLTGVTAEWFREQCLKTNAIFWRYLEERHGHALPIEQCSRLSILAETLRIAGVRIVDLIEQINSPDFQIGSSFSLSCSE